MLTLQRTELIKAHQVNQTLSKSLSFKLPSYLSFFHIHHQEADRETKKKQFSTSLLHQHN